MEIKSTAQGVFLDPLKYREQTLLLRLTFPVRCDTVLQIAKALSWSDKTVRRSLKVLASAKIIKRTIEIHETLFGGETVCVPFWTVGDHVVRAVDLPPDPPSDCPDDTHRPSQKRIPRTARARTGRVPGRAGRGGK